MRLFGELTKCIFSRLAFNQPTPLCQTNSLETTTGNDVQFGSPACDSADELPPGLAEQLPCLAPIGRGPCRIVLDRERGSIARPRASSPRSLGLVGCQLDSRRFGGREPAPRPVSGQSVGGVASRPQSSCSGRAWESSIVLSITRTIRAAVPRVCSFCAQTEQSFSARAANCNVGSMSMGSSHRGDRLARATGVCDSASIPRARSRSRPPFSSPAWRCWTRSTSRPAS